MRKSRRPNYLQKMENRCRGTSHTHTHTHTQLYEARGKAIGREQTKGIKTEALTGADVSKADD
jgi:hypothetical protein